jgi:proteasome lid subunit RPN8/RPN11
VTSSELTLTPAVRDALFAHAREGATRDPPTEMCGVLAGERGPPDRVTATRRVPNVADRPRSRYELDPGETVAAIDAVESEGLDVVGFYHSHPESAPVPSPVDRELATWQGYIYLILSPAADALRAYRLTDGGFVEVDVQVCDDA